MSASTMSDHIQALIDLIEYRIGVQLQLRVRKEKDTWHAELRRDYGAVYHTAEGRTMAIALAELDAICEADLAQPRVPVREPK